MAVLQQPVRAEVAIEELVTAAAAGDRGAESALVARFAAVVRTFARRRLHGDAVDEFAQEVLLRLVQAVRQGAVSEPARVGGFVLGICKNLARERARTAERRAALWAALGGDGDPLAGLAPPPDLVRYQLAQLEDCLSQLTERARDVVRRAYVDGASAAEIAAALALTEGNVRVVRHRALEALRGCMAAKLFYDVGAGRGA